MHVAMNRNQHRPVFFRITALEAIIAIIATVFVVNSLNKAMAKPDATALPANAARSETVVSLR